MNYMACLGCFEKKHPTRCMVTSVLMLEVNTMFLYLSFISY